MSQPNATPAGAASIPIDCSQLAELPPPNASPPLVRSGPIGSFVPAPSGTRPQKIFPRLRFGCFRQPRASVYVSWSRDGEATRRPQRLEIFLASGQYVGSSSDIAPPLNWYQIDSLQPGDRYSLRVHTRLANGWLRGDAASVGSHGCAAPFVQPAPLDPAELSPELDGQWLPRMCRLIDCSQYQQAVLLYWEPRQGQPVDAQRVVAELAGEEQNPRRSQRLLASAREAWWGGLRGGTHRFYLERRAGGRWIRSGPVLAQFPGCPQWDPAR